MNDTLYIILIATFVFLVFNWIVNGEKNEGFASETDNTQVAQSLEAIQTVASMYDKETNTLNLTNLNVTGNIKANTLSSDNTIAVNSNTKFMKPVGFADFIHTAPWTGWATKNTIKENNPFGFDDRYRGLIGGSNENGNFYWATTKGSTPIYKA